jgi:hypothetical protein
MDQTICKYNPAADQTAYSCLAQWDGCAVASIGNLYYSSCADHLACKVIAVILSCFRWDYFLFPRQWQCTLKPFRLEPLRLFTALGAE